jgi:hypothetical protein
MKGNSTSFFAKKKQKNSHFLGVVAASGEMPRLPVAPDS